MRLARGSPMVEDSLDVVAVRIENERRVVALVVLPLAGRSVVAIPGGQRDAVELLDLGPVPGREGEVHVLAQRLVVLRDREISPVRGALFLVRPRRRVPERLENGLVERLGRLKVRDPQRDVIDQRWGSRRARVTNPCSSTASARASAVRAGSAARRSKRNVEPFLPFASTQLRPPMRPTSS